MSHVHIQAESVLAPKAYENSPVKLLEHFLWALSIVYISVSQAFKPFYTILAPDGSPQNVALRKGGTKQYVITKSADPLCKTSSYVILL
jgi:hypothetical protein